MHLYSNIHDDTPEKQIINISNIYPTTKTRKQLGIVQCWQVFSIKTKKEQLYESQKFNMLEWVTHFSHVTHRQ